MATGAHINGSKELKTALGKLIKDLDEIGVEAITEWGDDVRGQARRGVPIRTGNLGSAIDKRVNRTSLKVEVGVWEDDAYYAKFVEQGTSSMEAQPFLGPAFDRHRTVTPYIKEALERRL